MIAIQKYSLIFLLISATVGASAFSGGSGSESDPYQISQCDHFEMANEDLSAYYLLTQDLDCNFSSHPIGSGTQSFQGEFDGGNNTFTYEIQARSGDASFISAIDEGATVKNFELIEGTPGAPDDTSVLAIENNGTVSNVNIAGEIDESDNDVGLSVKHNYGQIANMTVDGNMTITSQVTGAPVAVENYGSVTDAGSYGQITGDESITAGLVASNYGDINRSYAENIIDVTGQSNVPGLVATNYDSGVIQDSYTRSDLTAGYYAIGLVRRNEGVVKDSFSASNLDGFDEYGLIETNNGAVSNIYWDSNKSGNTGNTVGEPLTTEEMTINARFNMNLNYDNTWDVSGFDYPKLYWQETGQGTDEDPFQITSCQELQAMENNLDAYYELTNDIDCSVTEQWNGGQGFDPVGDGENPFTGYLDGQGYIVENLGIQRPSEDYVGLFGVVGGTRPNTVQSVGLENVNIEGSSDVGAFIGRNNNNLDTVTFSYATGEVTADDNVGGLIGSNFGRVLDSFFRGEVQGGIGGIPRTGGVIGSEQTEAMERVYFSGTTNGQPLAGEEVGVTITESYWDKDTTGQNQLEVEHGGEALHNYEMTGIRAVEYMEGFDFSRTWTALDNDRYPELSVFTDESGLDPRNPQPPGLPGSVYPSNGSEEEIARYLETGFTTRHPDALSMDVNFTSEEGVVYGQASSSDLTVAFSEWNGLNTGTNYEWYTTIEDSNGAVLNTSKWIGNWNFTTLHRPENPSNPYPSNNSQAFPVDENISIDAYQEDGRNLASDLYLTDDSGLQKEDFGKNASTIVDGGEGTAEFGQSNIDYQLDNGTTYSWFVNSTFTESVSGEENPTYFNESRVYRFTTYESPEPDQFMPSDGETGINPEPGLNVSIDHYENVTVEFFDAGDDSSLGTVDVQNGWANLTGYNDFDTTGTEFWYINATADSGEEWSNKDDPWNFTVSNVQNLDMNLQTEDGINLNNGSADIGPRQNLEASVSFDGSGEIEIGFEIFNQSGSSVANLTDQVSDGETASVDIQNAGLQQDRNYTWTTFYEESGNEPFDRPDRRSFTTLTVEADWQRQSDDSGEEIEVYYANSCSANFREDYEKAGSVSLDSTGLSGVTSVADTSFSEGDISLQLTVSNILDESNPRGECETVSIP